MNTIELFSIVSSTISIVLAIVAIYLSVISERRSSESHTKTMEALQAIDKRSAVTESIVGENFQKMMATVLGIVETATVDKEVQKAQVAAKSAESSANIQAKLFDTFKEVIMSGDNQRAELFWKIVQSAKKSKDTLSE